MTGSRSVERGQNCTYSKIRPVVCCREVSEPNRARFPRVGEGAFQKGAAVRIREMPLRGEHTALQMLWIRTTSQHMYIVIRFDHDQLRSGECFERAVVCYPEIRQYGDPRLAV